VDLEAEVGKVRGHGVGHRPLAGGRALDLAVVREVGDQPLTLGLGGRRRH
jgi:hypothetical protein